MGHSVPSVHHRAKPSRAKLGDLGAYTDSLASLCPLARSSALRTFKGGREKIDDRDRDLYEFARHRAAAGEFVNTIG